MLLAVSTVLTGIAPCVPAVFPIPIAVAIGKRHGTGIERKREAVGGERPGHVGECERSERANDCGRES